MSLCLALKLLDIDVTVPITMLLAPTTRSESAGIIAVVAEVETAQAVVRTNKMKTRPAIRLILLRY